MNNQRLGMTLALAFGLGLACADDGGGGDELAGTCEPGEVADCACPDGSTGEQACAEDGMSYESCECAGGETGEADAGDGDGDTGDGDTGDGDGDTGDGDGDTGDGDGDGEPIGEPPVVSIFHPGDGEVRQVNVPIPWIGEATDAEDGILSPEMNWWSSLDGDFGVGENFNAPLTTIGQHQIVVEVMDSDGNIGSDSLMLTIE